MDGEEVPVGRADYVLRAINVPAGKHTVRLLFEPKSVAITETIAYCALGILLAGAIVLVVLRLRSAGDFSTRHRNHGGIRRIEEGNAD